MRILPTLLLICILVPAANRPSVAFAKQPEATSLRLCASTWGDVRKASNEGDSSVLIGMLYPKGIVVWSSDGSVSKASLSQAIQAWNSALRQPMFRLARAGETASVDAKKTPTIETKDDLQGLVSAETDEGGHITAKILVSSANGGQPLTDVEVGSVVTHEFGHLLGLDDAPDGVKPGQYIMDGFDPNHVVLKPSPSEVAAVEELRDGILENLRELQAEDL